jgi:hypothetical protein
MVKPTSMVDEAVAENGERFREVQVRRDGPQCPTPQQRFQLQ